MAGSTVTVGASGQPAASPHSGSAEPIDAGVVPRATTRATHEGITKFTYNGSGIATRENNTTYVWADGHTWAYVTVQAFEGQQGQPHRICLEAVRGGANVSWGDANTSQGEHGEVANRYGCEEREVGSAGTRVDFNVRELSLETGPYRMVATAAAGNRTDNESVPFFVVDREDDLDGDGLTNEREVDLKTDIDGTDTDGDGLADGVEVKEYNTDPADPDTDDDGARDAVEINEGSNATVPHSDADGLADGAELNEYNTDPTDPDTDDDGLTDDEEVNEYDTDPTNDDTDGDGFSDGAEVHEYDTDPNDPNSHPRSGPVDRFAGLAAAAVSNPLTWAVLAVLVGIGAAAYARRNPGAVFGSDGTGGEAEASPAAAANGDGAADDGEELLPPDERVHRLLDANGGRLKQSEFVDLTDWSKAKVSRVLSRMEEDGEIERERIGRENVVSRPEDDIEAESSGADG